MTRDFLPGRWQPPIVAAPSEIAMIAGTMVFKTCTVRLTHRLIVDCELQNSIAGASVAKILSRSNVRTSKPKKRLGFQTGIQWQATGSRFLQLRSRTFSVTRRSLCRRFAFVDP